MDQRPLGDRGPHVSVVGLGCNNFGMKLDRDGTDAVVRAALAAGINHFDTAEMYGGGRSEEFLGASLGADRDRVVVATKFSPRKAGEPYVAGALARRIREACEGSLRRLATDRIDLYYQHYPDAEAPADEAIETLEALVAEGKVLHIGVSNVDASQAGAVAGRAVAAQIEWSLLARGVESEVAPAVVAAGMGVVPYFPLASGMLTGKYRRNEPFPEGSRLAAMSYFAAVATPDNFTRVEGLQEYAEANGQTLLSLAISWLLAQRGVSSVICGATTPAQVGTNAAGAGWLMSADDLAAIERGLAL